MTWSMCEHVENDLYILINRIDCCKSSHTIDKIWFEDKIEEQEKMILPERCSSFEMMWRWEYQCWERIQSAKERERKKRERRKWMMIGWRGRAMVNNRVSFLSLSRSRMYTHDGSWRVFLTLQWQVSFRLLYHTNFWFMCTVESISVTFRETDQLFSS